MGRWNEGRVSKGKTKFVLIVAGEASADLHGYKLVQAMRRRYPGITFQGIGGEKMAGVGVKTLFSATEMAVVGLTEVFSRLHTILRAYLRLRYLLKISHPDLLILIDYPDFNIPLAGNARRHGVPVLYYVSPQIWAWRKGRIKKIAKRVNRMAVILPFEDRFYRKCDLDVEYVGHPLLDSTPRNLKKDEIIREMGLKRGNPILGLLPGSRNEEIENLLPVMVKAAEIIGSRYPDLRCVLPLASTISPEMVQSIVENRPINITITKEHFYKTLALCDLALVASGTATLETAVLGVPMVVLYRVSPFTFWVAKRVVKVPYIGLVNLVAGEKIVPELIQNEVTPQRLAREAFAILQGEQRRENMIRSLKRVKDSLGKGGASERTAEIAIEMLTK